MDITSREVKNMSEKVSNREVLERFAKEIMQLQTQQQIDAFVNIFVYQVLLA